MKNQMKTTKPKDRKERRHINWGRFLFAGFLSATMLAANTMPVFAATTVWEKANEIMKDVYTQMLTCTNVILQATWNATPPTETASRCCSLSFAICPVSSDLTRRCSCKTSAAR